MHIFELDQTENEKKKKKRILFMIERKSELNQNYFFAMEMNYKTFFYF